MEIQSIWWDKTYIFSKEDGDISNYQLNDTLHGNIANTDGVDHINITSYNLAEFLKFRQLVAGKTVTCYTTLIEAHTPKDG